MEIKLSEVCIVIKAFSLDIENTFHSNHLFIKPQAIIDEVETNGAKFKMKKLFVVMIKYISPIFILLILVSSILNTFGIIKI